MQARFSIGPAEAGSLDLFLAGVLRMPAGKARDLVGFGAVYVNGRVELGAGRLLEAGDEVRVHLPRYGVKRFYETDPQRFLYRDPWLLAYDKEAGIPTQQVPYDAYNNVYAGLKRWFAANAPEDVRPALHHRLDQEVSGVILFSLSEGANRAVFRAFRDRTAEKVYLALVSGNPPLEDWVETVPIGRQGGRYLCTRPGEGKEAETAFRVKSRDAGLALIEARPRTGRTHQIRLHLAFGNLPVLGDRQYGGRPHPRCMLHALSLALPHPITGERLLLESPLPEEFGWALSGQG